MTTNLYTGKLFRVIESKDHLGREVYAVIRRDTNEAVAVKGVPWEANAEAEKMERESQQLRLL